MADSRRIAAPQNLSVGHWPENPPPPFGTRPRALGPSRRQCLAGAPRVDRRRRRRPGRRRGRRRISRQAETRRPARMLLQLSACRASPRDWRYRPRAVTVKHPPTAARGRPSQRRCSTAARATRVRQAVEDGPASCAAIEPARRPARRARPNDADRRKRQARRRVRVNEIERLAVPDQRRRDSRPPGRIERPRDSRRPRHRTARQRRRVQRRAVSSAAVASAVRTPPPLADCRIAVTTASV